MFTFPKRTLTETETMTLKKHRVDIGLLHSDFYGSYGTCTIHCLYRRVKAPSSGDWRNLYEFQFLERRKKRQLNRRKEPHDRSNEPMKTIENVPNESPCGHRLLRRCSCSIGESTFGRIISRPDAITKKRCSMCCSPVYVRVP